MHIYIPSRERAHTQITPIPPAWHDRTFMLVHKSERKDYEPLGYKVLTHNENNLADIREWVKFNAKSETVCMVDDDMRFHKRSPDGKLISPPVEDLAEMFDLVATLLEDDLWPAVGMMKRAFARDPNKEFYYNTALCGMIAFNRRIAVRENIVFNGGDIIVAEDHRFTLDLLSKGYQNIVLNNWAFSAKQHTPGGCDAYRVSDRVEIDFETLVKLFPLYVKRMDKKYPTGNSRYRISWRAISKDHDLCEYHLL